jgi:uncharacterized peroxidase-related enzyme
MSRIATPATIADAPEASRATLETLAKAFGGRTPNLIRVIANSPAALGAYVGLNGALKGGAIDAATRERIALATAEFDGCGYCLSAHTYLGRNVARLDDAEIAANRGGRSGDPKADAVVRFAAAVLETRGHVADADLAAVRAAGLGDGEIIEIVLHVVANILTNYVNEVARTVIDFPVVAPRVAA